MDTDLRGGVDERSKMKEEGARKQRDRNGDAENN